MSTAKLPLIVLLAYVGVVVTFESSLGYLQPTSEGTIVITTTDREGESRDRVLASLESQGQLYVARNHWPRAWYDRALEQPQVEITVDGERRAYLAVPVSGPEHDRVDAENSLGLVFRILTGFPTRHILRLDPHDAP